MITRCWKRLSSGLNEWWKRKASFGNIKNGNIMKNLQLSLIAKKRLYSGSCLKSPEGEKRIIKEKE
jgi:hypothetical protein